MPNTILGTEGVNRNLSWLVTSRVAVGKNREKYNYHTGVCLGIKGIHI